LTEKIKKWYRIILYQKKIHFAIIVFIANFLFSPYIFSQEKTKIQISGVVKDINGIPLQAAYILIKERKTEGTSTDEKGNFTLKFTDIQPATIIVNLIGYEELEIPYKGQKKLNITLKESASTINDVVVTGIYKRKKSTLQDLLKHIPQLSLNKLAIRIFYNN
jgi:hypothetical protein